jgi:hypothetical protein
MNLGGTGRVRDLGVGRLRLGVAQVFPHRGVQEVGLLADHAHDGGEVSEPHVADVDAVDVDTAAGGVVEAGDQCGEGGLAGSGRTSLSGRAVSSTARSRNGEATPTTEEAAMMAVTIASCQR